MRDSRSVCGWVTECVWVSHWRKAVTPHDMTACVCEWVTPSIYKWVTNSTYGTHVWGRKPLLHMTWLWVCVSESRPPYINESRTLHMALMREAESRYSTRRGCECVWVSHVLHIRMSHELYIWHSCVRQKAVTPHDMAVSVCVWVTYHRTCPEPAGSMLKSFDLTTCRTPLLPSSGKLTRPLSKSSIEKSFCPPVKGR